MTTTGAPIRVALVGLGWAGRSIWLPRLVAHPGFEVVAAVDAVSSARSAVREQAAGARLLSDVDDLTPELVDFAVVAVPNHLHSEIGCRLLRRGIAVFVEKPVCMNAREARDLAEAEQAGGAVLLAGSAGRYRVDVSALCALAPTLGTIRHVELSWVRAHGVPTGVGWFTRRDLAGGGALVDLGWHLLDVVEPLLGQVTVVQAAGSVSHDFVNDGARQADWRADDGAGGTAGDVEDTARGFLVTDAGVSVGLRVGWASHEPRDVTSIRVDGSDGSAWLQCTFGFSPNRLPTSSLTLYRDGTAAAVPLADDPVGAEYDRQLDRVLSLLADPGSRGRSVAQAAAAVDVIDRLYRSARLTHGQS